MKSLLAVVLTALTQMSAQGNSRLSLEIRATETVAGSGLSATNNVPRLTRKDVLSIKDGRFFLDGKPFCEISFNKFDLLWQLYDEVTDGEPLNAANPLVQAQDNALGNLHELGFKSIRIFALPWGPAGPASYASPEKRKNLYAALDKTLELCDAHDIRVVWSLSAASFTDTKLDPAKCWVYGEEQERELVSNPESRGRKLLYRVVLPNSRIESILFSGNGLSQIRHLPSMRPPNSYES
jgi:hypothetical protein